MLTLEGKLSGPWVDELERCWKYLHRSNGATVKVNLRDLSFLDVRGRGLLLNMEREGALLVDCPNFIRQLLGSNNLVQNESQEKTARREY